MDDALIDLASPFFWLTLLLGIFVLAPLAHGLARQVAFFAINLLFLNAILSTRQFLLVSGLLAAFWIGLKLVPRKRLGVPVVAGIALGLLFLFLVHKLPELPGGVSIPGGPVLAIIGFSYVALRSVEVLRSVAEGIQPPPSLISLANYLLPFHMLAGGPIQSYQEFASQAWVKPSLSMADVEFGVGRIANGVFKKFVLAAVVQQGFLTDYRADGPYVFLEAQMFYVWLYLDFSGYSDIAVGAGRLLGVSTPENFNRPYLARNLIDFWDRWHISLSLFIRRNLFVPVQLFLARRVSGSHALSIATVSFSISFVLCGLWHGLGTRFFLWGLMHAVGLSIVNFYRARLQRKLGASGVRDYMRSRSIRTCAQVLTFEYVAVSLLMLQYPFPAFL